MKQQRPAAPRLRIAAGQAIAVPAVGGSRVVVTGGRAWLTVEGDQRDFVLPPGGAFDCATDGLLVVQMLDAGTLTIELTGPASGASTRGWPGFIERLRAVLQLAPAAACRP